MNSVATRALLRPPDPVMLSPDARPFQGEIPIPESALYLRKRCSDSPDFSSRSRTISLAAASTCFLRQYEQMQQQQEQQ